MEGLCKGDVNPDLWFSNTLHNVIRAVTICSYCPATKACKAEGMKPENIDYGVWGGMLSGERLLEAGEPIDTNDRAQAIALVTKVRERISL